MGYLTRLGLLLVFITGNLLALTSCLSPNPIQNNKIPKQQQQAQKLGASQDLSSSADSAPSLSSSSSCSQQRRTFLSSLPKTLLASFAFLSAGVPLLYDSQTANAAAPRPAQLTTVVLDAPDDKIGVQLVDVTLGKNKNDDIIVGVKSLDPNGKAASSGVQEGMVLLTTKSKSSDIVAKIKQGPYPMAFQFYSLAEENDDDTVNETPSEALERVIAAAKTKAKSSTPDEGPPVSSRGAGLGVKTVVRPSAKASSCVPARRGDAVTIRYEARVASVGGPVYDSTAMRDDEPSTFVLGDGRAINGVDVGMGGMCRGEVRELDIPAGLGYGRYGSEVFDIPGDVRLWWRIELVDVVPKNGGGDIKR
jgi:FK506-binding protein 2